MLKSYDINVFLIPFERMCDLLGQHGIDFNWNEKDRDAAVVAWHQFRRLTESQKAEIGTGLIDLVRADLDATIRAILDDSSSREIDRVSSNSTPTSARYGRSSFSPSAKPSNSSTRTSCATCS